MPVKIKLSFKDHKDTHKDTSIVLWNTQKEEFFTISLNEAPSEIFFDPENQILKTAYYMPGLLSIVDNEKAKIKIFPNPANENLHLNIEDEEDVYSFQIRDMGGKLIQWGTLKSAESIINTRGFPSAYYILQLKSKRWKASRVFEVIHP